MIYLTGGAGFIGSNFISYLNANGVNKITIVDALGIDNKWKNLRKLSFKDIIKPEIFKNNIQNIVNAGDTIVHLGACSSTSETNVDFLWENNVQYSKFLIDFAVSNNIKIIYASSASVYGRGENGFNDNEGIEYERRLKPLNPYGFSKLKVDDFVYQENYENRVVGLRLFNVWGNFEDHKNDQASLISRITPQLLAGEKITLFKDKNIELMRDFIWVDDVCKVIVHFLISNDKGIYNVGSGEPQTWQTMVEALAKELNVNPYVKYIKIPDNLLPHYQFKTQANITKLQNIMKFIPTKLDEALKFYVERYKLWID